MILGGLDGVFMNLVLVFLEELRGRGHFGGFGWGFYEFRVSLS